MSQKKQPRMHTDEPVIGVYQKENVYPRLSVVHQEESKTLQVYRSCARISPVRFLVPLDIYHR